jgi:hypothetical protein
MMSEDHECQDAKGNHAALFAHAMISFEIVTWWCAECLAITLSKFVRRGASS